MQVPLTQRLLVLQDWPSLAALHMGGLRDLSHAWQGAEQAGLQSASTESRLGSVAMVIWQANCNKECCGPPYHAA